MNAGGQVSVFLLGPVEALLGDTKEKRAQALLRRKSRALLAYLAATTQMHHRESLANLFCQEAAAPLRALRLLLSRIRTQVGPFILHTQDDYVSLNHQAVWVDSREFERVLQQDLSQQPLPVIESAVALYRGEFLEGLSLPDAAEFELWLLGERARMRQLYERGLMEIVTRLTGRESFDAAISHARQLVQSNPLLEAAHARLIWLYAQTGRREAAVAQFQFIRELLQRELAVEPTPELQALYEEVITGRLPAWRVAAPVIAPAWALSADFVGRQTELAQLGEIWQAAQQGQGGVVLVAAEAGGGKTRLLQEFGRSLVEGSFQVGRCYESNQVLPYHPWIDLLETKLSMMRESELADLSPFVCDYLTRLLPGLARRLSRGFAAPPTAGGKSGELEHMFTAIYEFLCTSAVPNRPPVLFIDDLQWADETSLLLFHFLARRAGQAGIMLIGAFRSEEVEDDPALQTLLHDLARLGAQRIELRPLTTPDIEVLAAQLWPTLSEAHRLAAINLIARSTGGNPLFITEVLRELAGTSQLPAEMPVPSSIRDLIAHRLANLSHSGRQVIEALSIFHSSATLTEVQQVSARSEEETAQAIDLGLRRGLLQAEVDARPARYNFHHDLVREAVMGQLSHARRELLHRRVARALEPAGAKAAVLAYHWGMAGDTAKEGHYAALAGEEAAAIFAHDEAVRYFERALALLPETTRAVEVKNKLADIWVITGKWIEAEAMYRQALVAAERLGDLSLQAHSRALLARLLSRKGLLQEALAELQQARVAYETLGERKEIAGIIGTMGIIFWQMDEFDRALACYEEALQIERRLGNQANIAIWTANIANVYHDRRDYEKALAGYNESIRIHQQLGSKLLLGVSISNLGNTYRDMGDYRRALECYEQALQHRHSLDDKAGVATVAVNMGKLYAKTGKYTAALLCFRQALQIDLMLDRRESIADTVGQIGKLFLAEKEYEQALDYFDLSIPLLRSVEAKYYLCEQLVAKASALFERNRYDEADVLCQEGRALATGVNQNAHFSAQRLSIRLAVVQQRLNVLEAIKQFESLGQTATAEQEQAAVHYEIWRLDNQREDARQNAADLYRHLYAQTPNLTYRRRYEALTGETLPDPPPLPALPDVVGSDLPDLETLMRQVSLLT